MLTKIRKEIKEYSILTLATIVLIIGVYFFKFPNAFSCGGVTGLAIVLAKFIPATPSTITFVINMFLLVLGFIFLGKSFGIKTVYVSVFMSVGLSALEWIYPLSSPLTDQPVLEFIFAIFLPSASAALMFNLGASGGGTDIVAMILRKYTSLNIGTALMAVDLFIVIAACFAFDIETGLFSFCGLLAKSLVIDDVIENINLCKCFTIICEHPEPITKYINEQLGRSATIYKAEGAYTHTEKTVIITVLKRSQSVQLRNFIRETEPTAFITITKSSEIIGKGFRGFN